MEIDLSSDKAGRGKQKDANKRFENKKMTQTNQTLK